MIVADQIEELVPTSHPDVRKFLGIAHLDDSDQAARRMARAGTVPHLRIGGRIKWSIPALRAWAAQQISNSVKEPAEASALAE